MSTEVGHVLTVSTLSGSVLIPYEETTCLRNETSLFRNWHLDGFSLRPAVRILSNTKRRRRRCSLNEGAQIIISSKYTRQVVQVSSLRARFINLVEQSWPIRETKWHNPPFELPTMGQERCFGPVLFFYLHLPIPKRQIETGGPLATTQCFQDIIGPLKAHLNLAE